MANINDKEILLSKMKSCIKRLEYPKMDSQIKDFQDVIYCILHSGTMLVNGFPEARRTIEDNKKCVNSILKNESLYVEEPAEEEDDFEQVEYKKPVSTSGIGIMSYMMGNSSKPINIPPKNNKNKKRTKK